MSPTDEPTGLNSFSDAPRDTPLQSLGPVTAGERIVSMDVLRGFAVLGILVMNIQAFSMIGAAYLNPSAFGSLEGANYLVWYLSHLFADQKFMTIFSMLFGAGIVLMWERAQAVGRKSTGLHYRRMLWLMVFGLLHAYLLWYAEILFVYGFCGLFVYWFRKLRPAPLLVVGLIVLSVAPALSLMAGYTMPFWPEEQLHEMEAQAWNLPPEAVANEISNYQGNWSQQMQSRVPAALGMHTGAFIFWSFWRATGLMLIGMALFKFGIFSAAGTRRFYWTAVVLAIVVGLPIVMYGAHRNFAAGWDMTRFFFGGIPNYWGSLFVSMGWVSVIMLACKDKILSKVRSALADVGRMALTNYMMQTLICTTIFYGHGFGYFGEISRVGQILVVFAVWAFLIPFSVIWLRHFRFGPFEWLWRTLSYMKLQPMRV
jgi:uncharacterized protein